MYTPLSSPWCSLTQTLEGQLLKGRCTQSQALILTLAGGYPSSFKGWKAVLHPPSGQWFGPSTLKEAATSFPSMLSLNTVPSWVLPPGSPASNTQNVYSLLTCLLRP